MQRRDGRGVENGEGRIEPGPALQYSFGANCRHARLLSFELVHTRPILHMFEISSSSAHSVIHLCQLLKNTEHVPGKLSAQRAIAIILERMEGKLDSCAQLSEAGS